MNKTKVIQYLNNKYLQNPSYVTNTVLEVGHIVASKGRNDPYSHGIFWPDLTHSINLINF